jgi:hypothetical protein
LQVRETVSKTITTARMALLKEASEMFDETGFVCLAFMENKCQLNG